MSILCLQYYLRYISGFLATQPSAQVQPTPVEFTYLNSSNQSKIIITRLQYEIKIRNIKIVVTMETFIVIARIQNGC